MREGSVTPDTEQLRQLGQIAVLVGQGVGLDAAYRQVCGNRCDWCDQPVVIVGYGLQRSWAHRHTGLYRCEGGYAQVHGEEEPVPAVCPHCSEPIQPIGAGAFFTHLHSGKHTCDDGTYLGH
jgi:hypothetical protein